jgi:hypothetical protein
MLCHAFALLKPLRFHWSLTSVPSESPALQKLASDDLDETVANNVRCGSRYGVSRAVDYSVDCVPDGARFAEHGGVSMEGGGRRRDRELAGQGLRQVVGGNWVRGRLWRLRLALSEVHTDLRR